jgi:hypothetical protein
MKIKAFAKIIRGVLKYRVLHWLPDYVSRRRRWARTRNETSGNVHVMLAFVDHYEPSRSDGEKGIEAVSEWCQSYESICRNFTDSDGVFPQHSWFYRYDYPEFRCINILSEYCYRGFGEVEFHLHHGNSTEEWFERTIRDGKKWFQTAGAMYGQGVDSAQKFAYIAGNWALDNGQGRDEVSGVNNEIAVLARNDCYADFTFPAFGERAQPRMVNNIYSTMATPIAKSYEDGVDLEVHATAVGDLVLFQGPVYIDVEDGYFEYASFEKFTPYFSKRREYWLEAGVHVDGRPEWIFIKLHTHGMQSKATVLGDGFVRLLEDVVDLQNDGMGVHFVSAREAYNIAMAAKDGKEGDPNMYRDYLVDRPFNLDCYVSVPYTPVVFSESRFEIELEGDASGTVRLKRGPVEQIEFSAGVTRIVWQVDKEGQADFVFEGDGDATVVEWREGFRG